MKQMREKMVFSELTALPEHGFCSDFVKEITNI
jgi:hypothetical protein